MKKLLYAGLLFVGMANLAAENKCEAYFIEQACNFLLSNEQRSGIEDMRKAYEQKDLDFDLMITVSRKTLEDKIGFFTYFELMQKLEEAGVQLDSQYTEILYTQECEKIKEKYCKLPKEVLNNTGFQRIIEVIDNWKGSNRDLYQKFQIFNKELAAFANLEDLKKILKEMDRASVEQLDSAIEKVFGIKKPSIEDASKKAKTSIEKVTTSSWFNKPADLLKVYIPSLAAIGFVKNHPTAVNAVAYVTLAGTAAGLTVWLYKKMKTKKICPNCLEEV